MRLRRCLLTTFCYAFFAEPIVDHTAAENVVVPESGEESEDEWNYIKVKKEETELSTERLTPTPAVGLDNTEEPVAVEESHAVLHALAESQEACVDVR